MTEEVIPLRFDIEEVGKHVKSSKKRFTWELALKGRSHVVVLDFSFISGKVKVTVDRKILFQSELPSNTSFQYPFTLDGNALNVIQQGQNFELRINNKVFSHLYNQMKTNTQFKKYQDEVRDIKVDTAKLQGGNKKITLNIGGLGGGMKKKNKGENTYQQHNWNAFSPDSMSFPSYFEGSQTSTTASGMSKGEKTLKKTQNLLNESNQSINASKTQSILDFQSQLVKNEAPVYNTSENLMQFNTMQKMFATMNMGTGNNIQKPSVVVDNNQVDFFNDSPSNVSNVPTPPSELKQIFKGVSQYNTMQNLFSTNMVNNPPLNQNFNTKQSVNPILNTNSNVPSVNANDFSTMQQMFATNNNLYNFNLNTTSNNNNQSTQQKPTTSSEYNTMQLLFTTNNNQAPTVIKSEFNSNVNLAQSNNNASNINLNDFNTMQHMFSTTNPSMTGSFNTSNINSTNVQTANFNTNSMGTSNAKINPSEYNTMQNLFATTNVQSPVTNINLNTNMDINPKVINSTDYNTMRNLFATNSQSPQFKTNNTEIKVNQTEFNTMQNMFATSNGLFNLNVTSQNISKNQVKPQEQKINITNEPLSPNTMYMNTYSGVSSGQSGLQNGASMFTTGLGMPASGSMKKNKQHSALDIFELANNKPSTNNSSGDLL